MERTIEDVDTVLRHAKLDPSDFIDTTHVLSFDSTLLDPSQFKLLEVSNSLLDTILSPNSNVVIRGGERDDYAVLCTESKTFDVKEAETSNSLCLLPESSFITERNERKLNPISITSVFNRYLEIKERIPDLSKLYTLLNESPYSRFNVENYKGYTLDQLLDRIPCSKFELEAALRNDNYCFRCCCLIDNNKWVYLESDYQMKIWTLIENFVEENSWNWNDQVDKNKTIQTLSELEPTEILERVFDFYFYLDESSSFYVVNRTKVAQSYGYYLLGTGGTRFDVTEFMKIWKESVPYGFPTSLNLLDGIALVDGDKTIRLFLESSLPSNIQQRLVRLFQVREKWTLSQIEPYIRKLCTSQFNVNAVLMKYARISHENGVKMFSSKYSK